VAHRKDDHSGSAGDELGIWKESPHRLGPFIIMEFVSGVRLTNLLKQSGEEGGYSNQMLMRR
jgi:hypothetical protein